MTNKEQILEKITSNEAIVGIIGLGYVGLPLAVSFAQANIKVIGFDKNPEKVRKINSGENYIGDITEQELQSVVNGEYLIATDRFDRLFECDVLIICVPTPLDIFKKPDMSYIESACREIGQNMKPGTFISLESTTYPTTTENLMMPILERESGLKQSVDICFPKYQKKNKNGNDNYKTKNTPKVLGAMSDDGLEIGEAIYKKAIQNVHLVSSPRVAEMVKILENTYRLINISLINELALLAGKMDINIWEVIDAAKTKPFGFQAFYPGPGIGGHCIPLDPFYLEYIAKQYDFDLTMIHTAGHINMRMPHYMYIKIASALNKNEKSVSGSKILFLGVAYKPNIDDERESPALEIIDTVTAKGGLVSYNDPYIPMIKTHNGVSLKSVELTPETLSRADVVVITTNHRDYDSDFIMKHSNLIVDLRNVMTPDDKNKVFKL